MTRSITPKNSTTVLKNLRYAGLRASFALGGWLLPEATLHRAYDLFGTPLPAARRRARAADRGDALIGELTCAGERLRTYVWGDPTTEPTVLCAHGWSSYGLCFLPWVTPLRAAGYAVVGFDQIGHGDSSGHRSTLPIFAECVASMGRHYGPLAAVVGHSLGGAAAMLALADGLDAKRAILIAPPADPHEAALRFGNLIGLPGHLAANLSGEFESRTSVPVASLRAHVRVPSIGKPALIVHDVEDREVPWAEGERYARFWADARLLSTCGLGHNRIVGDPGVIDAAMRFLAGDTVGERVVSSPNLPYGFA